MARRVKVYSVGIPSKFLPQQVTDVEFSGDTIEALLKSIKAGSSGETLYDELVERDGSYKSGRTIAVNGEVVLSGDLSKPVPNLSELVVIHVLTIPAGG